MDLKEMLIFIPVGLIIIAFVFINFIFPKKLEKEENKKLEKEENKK